MPITCVEYWESIDDMILSFWMKCIGGDYRYSRKKVDLSIEETQEDLSNWIRQYDTYLARYGFNPKYERILKAMRKKALLEIKYVLTRDEFLRTLISIEEAKLEQLRRESNKGITTTRMLIHLSRWYRSHLTIDTVTVAVYNDLCEEYGKASKEN